MGTAWGQPHTPCPRAAVPVVPPPPSPVPSPFQPRPSASLVSPRGMPWPHPAVPSPTLALAGWCPLSPTGAQTTQLLVDPPWMPPVEWDRVTLTCQGSGTADATTWYKDGQRWWQRGPDHFAVTRSGTYTCARSRTGRSPPVTWGVLVPAWALLEGDTVTLRCRGWRDSPITSVSFYHDGKKLDKLPDGTGLFLSPLQLNHSGSYSCRGWVKYWTKTFLWSAPVTVTVHAGPSGWGSPHPRHPHPTSPSASPVCVPAVPVANATITPGPLSHQVPAGDNVTLHCSVQVGSAPVTFTWLHNGQEVAQGPLLELGDIDVGHSGTYQCVATNQLGQDGHRVFRALSPELALEVTTWGHRDTGDGTRGHCGGLRTMDLSLEVTRR
uniref:Uncharacterized protein n=1 Tax=Geospiza parvula TaxID=87175 RepID=A0A8C3Q8Q6_GEOPR